jgi:hypothetical protein
MRPRAVSALLLALAVVLLGCASGDDDDTGTTTVEVVVTDKATGEPAANAEAARASRIKSHIDSSDVVKLFPPTIVLDGDIREHRKGTPERALLQWWQAFQFHDVTTVKALTSPSTLKAIGPHSLAELVRLSGLPGVSVLGATTTGDTAVVQGALLNFQSPGPGAPPPREPTGSQPATFKMAMGRGGWLFDDTEFLLPKVTNLKK